MAEWQIKRVTGLGLSLAMATTSLACCLHLSAVPQAYGQMGPQPVPQKPKPEGNAVDNLKKSFKRFFTPAEGEAAGTEEGAEAKQQVKAAPKRPPLIEKPTLARPEIATPQASKEDPPVKLPSLDSPGNPLGLSVAEDRLNEVADLLEKKQIGLAKAKLVPLRQWLIEATEAHIDLYKALSKLPSARAQAELEKQLALEFAILRDKSLYQMANIYVAERNHREAIKGLTEIVKSQPSSVLGIKSYKLLQQIGFTQKLQLVN